MAGDALRRIQTGQVQDYVFGVAVGVLALLWWLGGAASERPANSLHHHVGAVCRGARHHGVRARTRPQLVRLDRG